MKTIREQFDALLAKATSSQKATPEECAEMILLAKQIKETTGEEMLMPAYVVFSDLPPLTAQQREQMVQEVLQTWDTPAMQARFAEIDRLRSLNDD